MNRPGGVGKGIEILLAGIETQKRIPVGGLERRKRGKGGKGMAGTGNDDEIAKGQEPARFPLGIERVYINGRPVVQDGRYDADAQAGRVLRA